MWNFGRGTTDRWHTALGHFLSWQDLASSAHWRRWCPLNPAAAANSTILYRWGPRAPSTSACHSMKHKSTRPHLPGMFLVCSNCSCPLQQLTTVEQVKLVRCAQQAAGDLHTAMDWARATKSVAKAVEESGLGAHCEDHTGIWTACCWFIYSNSNIMNSIYGTLIAFTFSFSSLQHWCAFHFLNTLRWSMATVASLALSHWTYEWVSHLHFKFQTSGHRFVICGTWTVTFACALKLMKWVIDNMGFSQGIRGNVTSCHALSIDRHTHRCGLLGRCCQGEQFRHAEDHIIQMKPALHQDPHS